MAFRTGGAECAQRLSLLRSPRSPSLRLSSPLIEPGVQISRTQLSDGFHAKACARPTERSGDKIPETGHPESQTRERGGLQDNRGTDQPARVDEERTHPSDDAIRDAETRCPFPNPIEDQQLLLEEHGFGDQLSSRTFCIFPREFSPCPRTPPSSRRS